MHSLPNNLHCAGFRTPFRTSPHCAALGSVTRIPGIVEALLGVPFGILLANAKRRLGNETQAAPFEIRAELKYFGHGFQRGAIAFPGNDALVLIFDFGFALLKLA